MFIVAHPQSLAFVSILHVFTVHNVWVEGLLPASPPDRQICPLQLQNSSKKSNSTVCGARWALVAKSCLRQKVLQKRVLILLHQHKPGAPLMSVGSVSALTEGLEFNPNCSWFADGEVIAPPRMGRLLWAPFPWQPARLAAEEGFSSMPGAGFTSLLATFPNR